MKESLTNLMNLGQIVKLKTIKASNINASVKLIYSYNKSENKWFLVIAKLIMCYFKALRISLFSEQRKIKCVVIAIWINM